MTIGPILLSLVIVRQIYKESSRRCIVALVPSFVLQEESYYVVLFEFYTEWVDYY